MRVLNHTPYKVLITSEAVSPPEPVPFYPKGEPKVPPPTHQALCVRVKGTFRIDMAAKKAMPWDPPPPVVAAEDGDQADFVGDSVFMDDLGRSMEYGGDSAPYKGKVEFLVYGHCYQADGKPRPGCRVAVTVGAMTEGGMAATALKKELVVAGLREWIADGDQLRISGAVPFDQMPLRWEMAYGGLTDMRNPMGRGQELGLPTDLIESDEDSPNYRLLPSLEYPDQAIALPTDSPEPANFGPLLPHWQPRATLAGTRDQRWATFRAPLPPKDFDPGYHNLAPVDQHFPAELNGTEAIRFENLHPKRPLLEVSLPGVRLRMFVAQVTKQRIHFHEAPLRLDTLHLYPDQERILLMWRQLVAEHEYTHLCLAQESAHEPAKPIDDYREEFDPELIADQPKPQEPPLGMDEAELKAKVQATMAEGSKILAESNADPKLQKAFAQVKDPQAGFDLLLSWLENQPKLGA